MPSRTEERFAALTERRRRLGNSDMAISPIGFGAWAIGGSDWANGWGPQNDAESIAAIRRALDLGVNWIDTAAVYGLGHSEEIVARAVQGRTARPYIFTKCSLVWGPDREVHNSLQPDSIRRECEASLRRLQVEAIDLYQIHWPNPNADIEIGWRTLAALQQEGKVRYIGVSNFNIQQMRRVLAIAPITSLQPPYSLIKPAVDNEILPFARANNIGVIVYSPMQSGLLTGAMTRERAAQLPADDWRSRNPDFQEPRLSRNLALVDVLRGIGERHGCSPGEVAIAWTLRNPAVTGAIVGARRPDQVEGVLGAAGLELTPDDLAAIDNFRRDNP